MKYRSKIVLSSKEIRKILAKHFGVKPDRIILDNYDYYDTHAGEVYAEIELPAESTKQLKRKDQKRC